MFTTPTARQGRPRGRPSRRLLAVVIALVVVCAVGASAYWTGVGTGGAMAVVPDLQGITLSPGTAVAHLFPGDDASVAIVAHNDNPFFVHISSLQLDTSEGDPFSVDAGHAGCDTSAISFVGPQDNGGAGWDVPPRVAAVAGTATINMDDAMLMSIDAANACQGATFTVRLVAPS
jgi:hypothetical protein